jgi:hypothetical protein
MTNGWKQQLLRYWLAMNAGALQAGAHSARAFLAIAGAHAAVDSIPALGVKQLAAVFLLAFGNEALKYLDTHALPISLSVPNLNPIQKTS